MNDLAPWVNPATVRGTVYIVFGLVILSAPQISAFLLGVVIGVAVVFFGATTLWSAVRQKPIQRLQSSIGAVALASGLLFLITPESVSGFFALALAIALSSRGGWNIYHAVGPGSDDTTRVFRSSLGFLYIAAATVVWVLPDSLSSSLIVGTAVVALIAGAITLGVGLTTSEPQLIGTMQIGGFAKKWLGERDLGDEMRADVIDDLFFEQPDVMQKQVGFWVLLILSTAIATLGILADSTAVVIGAMLVAPLMTPILGMSAGIVNGWMGRVGRSFATVVGGVAVSVLTAWIVSVWAPHLILEASNSQILSRTNPTLLDLMIAVAAGAAGAYATVDKRVSSSITGVAIAVALVPPLGVVGIELQTGNFGDATGAFLLFVTNLVAIVLAASVVFVITGFAVVAKLKENREKMKTVLTTLALGTFIIIVPLAFTSEGIIASASRQATAQTVAEEWLSESESLDLNRVRVTGTDVEIVITGQGDVPPVADLEAALSDAMQTSVTATVQFLPTELLTADP